MRIAVTGSIATDHLMTFPGKFVDNLMPDNLANLSISFLVDALEVRRGGVAPNISFGLAQLGHEPVLIGAVGRDFDTDYRSWLDRHGVETSAVLVSDLKHTARFLCTTDADQNQIASFYTGAMAEARDIELAPILRRFPDVELVVISPNDPEAMLRHTEEARRLNLPFMADPSQQLTYMDGPEIRGLIEGATCLVTNHYEKGLLEQKTGWSDAEVLDRVGLRITTKGAEGCIIESRGEEPIIVHAAQERRKADPTGVGDAFRAGFLSGLGWGLSLERSAQIGSLLATYVLEHIGTQEYRLNRTEFRDRFEASFGPDAAKELQPHLV